MLTKGLLGTVYQRAYLVEESWVGCLSEAMVSTFSGFSILDFHFRRESRLEVRLDSSRNICYENEETDTTIAKKTNTAIKSFDVRLLVED